MYINIFYRKTKFFILVSPRTCSDESTNSRKNRHFAAGASSSFCRVPQVVYLFYALQCNSRHHIVTSSHYLHDILDMVIIHTPVDFHVLEVKSA